MKRLPVIAIDGYSSTGKSSISKQIAKKLGLIHMDTGALYRGITLFALQNCSADGKIDKDILFKNFDNMKLEFREESGVLVLYLNDKNISSEIRSLEVSNNVSFIAKQSEVRDFLMETQRSIASNGGVVMDGRDIGTVVLPNADYKFFLTASVEERTRRRHLELISLGEEADVESVKNNLVTRDKIDSEREFSPLKQAEDAILIDNTNLNQEETLKLILSYIKEF
ncbi:(d)CMP kinase [uncultured Chryseobacterium sp.]|uniref:(d)CMP kinase n=1 Tax=uncultured Chryseobacterium sp. TaxID=259322 RepID=UPI00262CC5C0|nr:(d)CMP kinase [uncultured Chryseobacterium sp.]